MIIKKISANLCATLREPLRTSFKMLLRRVPQRKTQRHAKKSPVICIIFFLISVSVFTQEPIESVNRIELISRTYPDSICLRWAPSNPEMWQLGNHYGYLVVRKTIKPGAEYTTDSIDIDTLTPTPIKPWTLSQIEEGLSDNYMAIVAQAVYGQTFDVKGTTGTDVSRMLNKAREIQNRFSFSLFAADMSYKAAQAHGLAYIDKDLNRKGKYLYQILLANPDTACKYEAGLTLLSASDTFTLPAPENIRVAFHDGIVELSWSTEFLKNLFTCYRIERSMGDSLHFKPVSDQPVVTLASDKEDPGFFMYNDTAGIPGMRYYYRVRGVTAFAETGPASHTVSVLCEEQDEFLSPIITTSVPGDGKVNICWEVQEPEKIKGYKVYLAPKDQGPYVTVTPDPLPADKRCHTVLTQNNTNYIKVASIDRHGKEHSSMSNMALLADSIPPPTPNPLSAICDSHGIALITWEKVTAPDLMSYRVYRSNNPDAEFMKINTTEITAASFIDTVSLGTLTKKRFYKIAAIDNHYNESPLSDILVLVLPDTIAPAAPLITGYEVTEKGITINWVSSPGNDVTKHLLYRKAKNEQDWKLIALFENLQERDNMYTDSLAESGMQYSYNLLAVDEAGLESKTGRPVEIACIKATPDVAVAFKATADRENKQIVLKFDLTGEPLKSILIYKSVDKQPWALIDSVDGKERAYKDKQVKPGRQCAYKVQGIYHDNRRSVLSPEALINY